MEYKNSEQRVLAELDTAEKTIENILETVDNTELSPEGQLRMIRQYLRLYYFKGARN